MNKYAKGVNCGPAQQCSGAGVSSAKTGFLSTGPSPPSHLWHAQCTCNLLKTTWGPTTKTISGLGPYLKQVQMAEGSVANRNGMVMGKGVMGLSTLLFSRNVAVMPKKSRTSVWGLLCK